MAFVPLIGAALLPAGATAGAAMAMGTAVVGSTVLGIGASAYGSYQQGQIAKDEANYNAAVSKNNAISSMQDAESSAVAGSAEAARIRSRTRRNADSQIAAAAGSGLQVSGSVNDVLLDSYIQGETDALLADYQGRAGAHRSGAEAGNFFNQASQQKRAGKNAARTGKLNAFSTILSQGGNAAMNFASF